MFNISSQTATSSMVFSEQQNHFSLFIRIFAMQSASWIARQKTPQLGCYGQGLCSHFM